MTEDEYRQIVSQAYKGELLVGVDSAFARKLFTDVPISKIRELTGESPYVEKGIIWFFFLASPLFALASFLLTGIVFHWFALLIIPIFFVLWFIYKGLSSRGGVGLILISGILLSTVMLYFSGFISNKNTILCFVIFFTSLWCERFIYWASTFFFRCFILRNYRAFIYFADNIRIKCG